MIECVSRRILDGKQRKGSRLLTAVVITGVCLVAPATAQVSAQPPAVSSSILTPKRLVASGGAMVALVGTIIGGLALARSARGIGPGKGRRGAMVAVVTGPIGLAVGGLVVTTATGGLGTGNGIAGGFVAIALGLTATALGGFVLARSSRIT